MTEKSQGAFKKKKKGAEGIEELGDWVYLFSDELFFWKFIKW